MQLHDVRDYLKKIFPEAEHFYIGKLDASQEKCICVYDGNPLPAVRCIGLQTYQELPVSILIHWNENARGTQAMASVLYQRLYHANFPEIGGHIVAFIKLLYSCPLDCTPPDSSVYEYVINLNIIYHL